MNRENSVPLWHKYSLTITEASEYFNIGEKKLRQMVQENATADFLLNNGVKVLIKRAKFEHFLDETCSI
ncbi:excisionase [Roseburia hominis]|uniref:excisionase n=1 Tax=Roseburia hominis TaxID=301301 RepID=UPI0026EBDB06|nr:excisionase [Roseburia hominis]MCI7523070.1 transposase [Roseburia hominis]